jgi:MoxR-like ATPase
MDPSPPPEPEAPDHAAPAAGGEPASPPAETGPVTAVGDLRRAIQEQVARVVFGQEALVDGLMTALLTEGHVLLEGPPGTAKTLLARVFAASLGFDFKRIQFTPDLLPGDLIGTNLFHFESQRFTLTRGPVFTDFLLADEINRTPPKTQAALLQAMQERQVTLDGETHALSPGFLVVATQNPIEHEGTYPLPEAQLDRFLLKLHVPFPERDAERRAVEVHGHRTVTPRLDDLGLVPLASLEEIGRLRSVVQTIRLAPELVDYVVDLVRASREHPSVLHGASPRAATMLAAATRARAALDGRDYALPDDVKALAPDVLRHRLILAPSAEIEEETPDGVVARLLDNVPAPR